MAANSILVTKFTSYRNCLSLLVENRETKELTIYSAQPLIDYSLAYNPEASSWFVYCCTTEGHFYKLSLLEAYEKVCSKANSLSGQDVFSGLLDEEESADGIQLSVSTKPVYQLQSHDLVFKFEESVFSLCVALDFVVITCRTGADVKVQVYGEQDFCRKAQSVITPIRVVKLARFYKSVDEDCPKAILTKCLTSDEVVTPFAQNYLDSINISSKLYKTIVGEDACLLGSPAVVISPPGGSLYIAPIKLLLTDPSVRTSVINPQVTEAQTSFSEFKLLCETTNDVVLFNVVQVKVSTEGDGTKRKAELLVICCQNGLVRLVCIPEDNGQGCDSSLQTLSFLVDNPVECACSFKDKLYHSTGRYVCETTLSLNRRSSSEVKYSVQTEVRRFQLPGIEDITAYLPAEMIDSEDTQCVIQCYHTDGRATKFNSWEGFKEYKPYEAGNQAEMMKETLLAIDSIDKKREQVEKQLTEFEHILKQINMAATLYQQYVQSVNTGSDIFKNEQGFPFKFRFNARVPEGEMSDHIMIDCEIINQTGCVLSCDWSVMVTIQPNSIGENIVSRSFKISDDFLPSQSLTISMPVKPNFILIGYEAAVYLILHISFVSDRAKNLCIPIHQESIDAMYFLFSDNGVTKNMNMKKLGSCLLGEQLLQFAKARPAGKILLGRSSSEKSQTSVCIDVSFTLRNGKIIPAIKSPPDPGNILCYLLKDSGISQERLADTGCYRTFLGQPVYLSAAVSQSGRETTLMTVSIRSDLATAASVHKALKYRVQFLSTETSIPALQTENLKRKLYELQDLENDLTRLQTDRECQKDLSGLAAVYEKLRKITSFSQ